jgi:hypothetical protein
MDFFPPVTLSPGQKTTYTRVLNTGVTSGRGARLRQLSLFICNSEIYRRERVPERVYVIQKSLPKSLSAVHETLV